MNKRFLSIILFSLFIIDAILVKIGFINIIDDFIYKGIIFFKGDIFTYLMRFISFLASTKMIIFYNIVILIYVFLKKNKSLLIIPLSSTLSFVINNIVKAIIKRDRPIGIALVKESFYSFPSGHSMISVLFFGTIIYLINKNKIKNYKVISTLISIFIILVGISRIYLGVHYVSDVIGGYLLGLVVLLLLINFDNK